MINEWMWCAQWCKERRLSPFFADNWDAAKEAYLKYKQKDSIK